MEILVTQYFFEAYDDLKSAMVSYKKIGIQYLRLNITSNNYGYYQTQINKIREVSKEINYEVKIFLDIAYPGIKYRIKTPKEKELSFSKGDILYLTYEDCEQEEEICISFKNKNVFHLFKNEKEIYFDDSNYRFSVISSNEKSMKIEAQSSGNLKNKKSAYSFHHIFECYDSISEFFNIEFISFLRASKPDGLILSFCENAKTVKEVQNICHEIVTDMAIIPKIETQRAIDNLDEIVTSCHQVMLGRGDLCIRSEDAYKLHASQNKFFNACKKYGVTSIVATDILKSLETGRYIPNRAELIDLSILKENADMICVSAYLAKNEDYLSRFLEFCMNIE